jgi:hypothetical protein
VCHVDQVFGLRRLTGAGIGRHAFDSALSPPGAPPRRRDSAQRPRHCEPDGARRDRQNE